MGMIRRRGGWAGVCLILGIVGAAPDATHDHEQPKSADPPAPASPGPEDPVRLGMTRAIACRTIQGYDRYQRLPGAALTRDDKLLVYYKPFNFFIEPGDGTYRAHLAQEARIRRHDEKAVLWSKPDLVDYLVEQAEPPTSLYIANTIAIKDLTPGDYDLDIVLRDLLSGGPPARQTLRFRVELGAEPEQAP